jgi:hypothetical protein
MDKKTEYIIQVTDKYTKWYVQDFHGNIRLSNNKFFAIKFDSEEAAKAIVTFCQKRGDFREGQIVEIIAENSKK